MKKIYQRHSLLTPDPAELSLRITSHENKPFIIKQEEIKMKKPRRKTENGQVSKRYYYSAE